MFRQIERWLHQHIFKVGWLLSDSFQVTTILYYILFLPGIVLHEATLWLAAGALKVRAERSIGFPKPQEIGELRLNFIRLAEDTGRAKRMIIRLGPVLAGMTALWVIAAHVFRWEELLALAAVGSLEGVIAALTSLTEVADLWLWFYLAFVIANTMFPTLSQRSDRREKALVLVTAPALAFTVWRLALAGNPAVAAEIEALVGSIALVIGQITLVNAGAVVVLGAVETVTERVTKRSATFRDGKMLTMSRQAARELDPTPRRRPRAAPSLNSIYDLKLPIPGPPGREPVSRSAVAVVSVAAATEGPTSEPDEQAKPTRADIQERPAAATVSPDSVQVGDECVDGVMPLAGPNAPFDRPFVNHDSTGSEREAWREEVESDTAEPFARPFVMSSRAGQALDSTDTAHSQPGEEPPAPRSRRSARPSRTRPAPKPSQRAASELAPTKPEKDGELEYEAFDDDLPHVDDDDMR